MWMKKSYDKNWQSQEKIMQLIAWLTHITFRMATCHSPSSSNFINFLRISYKRWPIAQEENSPVATAAKTGVRVYAKVNSTFGVLFFSKLLVYDLTKNKIQDLIYRWQQEYCKMKLAKEVQARKVSLAGTPFERSPLFFHWKLTSNIL